MLTPELTFFDFPLLGYRAHRNLDIDTRTNSKLEMTFFKVLKHFLCNEQKNKKFSEFNNKTAVANKNTLI